jgi:hypothetical protein
MSHWHKCRICKEYFECCRCEASHRLSVCCQDCTRELRETLFVDSALKQLFRRLSSNNQGALAAGRSELRRGREGHDIQRIFRSSNHSGPCL